jgi:hypothetical protein
MNLIELVRKDLEKEYVIEKFIGDGSFGSIFRASRINT